MCVCVFLRLGWSGGIVGVIGIEDKHEKRGVLVWAEVDEEDLRVSRPGCLL